MYKDVASTLPQPEKTVQSFDGPQNNHLENVLAKHKIEPTYDNISLGLLRLFYMRHATHGHTT